MSDLDLPPDLAAQFAATLGPLTAGPLLGEVSASTARIWIQARDDSPLKLVVRDAQNELLLFESGSVTPQRDDWYCVTFVAHDLPPSTPLTYTITSDGHGSVGPFAFRSAPENDARRVRIALGSCHQRYTEAGPILDHIRAREPDLLVLMGDNTYFRGDDDNWHSPTGDWSSAKRMMWAHLRHRLGTGVPGLTSVTPTIAIWDDHDYGEDNAEANNPLKHAALAAFRRMWPRRYSDSVDSDGIDQAIRFGPVEVFLLDVRTHRSSRYDFVVGNDQLHRLFVRLSHSTAPVKLVVSGSQIIPSAPSELGWDCWLRTSRRERKQLLDFLADTEIPGVILASGDQHLGFLILRRGRGNARGNRAPDLWELTSSPLSGPVWPKTLMHDDDTTYDPTVLLEVVAHNYGWIDIDLDRPGEEVELSLVAESSLTTIFTATVIQRIPLATLAKRRLRPRRKFVRWTADSLLVFGDDSFVRFSLRERAVVEGPAPIGERFFGLDGFRVDAAYLRDDYAADFFAGNGCVTINPRTRVMVARLDRYVLHRYHGLPTRFLAGIDAALALRSGAIYLFHGSEYVRYDLAADRVVSGPRPIVQRFPGVFVYDLDGAVSTTGDTVLFFRHDQVIRFDLATRTASPPAAIADELPGVP